MSTSEMGVRVMSAIPPIVIELRTSRHVSKVPNCDIAANSIHKLFDHLIGAQQERFWNRYPKRFCGSEVDD
jgi:hypothetical protein